MKTEWIAFICGLFLGGIVGVVGLCLCFICKEIHHSIVRGSCEVEKR